MSPRAFNSGVRTSVILALAALAGILAGCVKQISATQPAAPTVYFDPHNHLSGVLPWQAYADLPAYIRKLEGHGDGVSDADERALYAWLDETWYPAHRADLDDKPFATDQRYALGARATLELYPPQTDDSAQIAGALERILTATPYTEFDSSYAFRGGPVFKWQSANDYHGNTTALNEDLCTADVLQLARTRIADSEQSISFVGGWGLDASGDSWRLDNILCAARKPQELAPVFSRLGEPMPRVRIILMTLTYQLGENQAGDAYSSFEHTGVCHEVPLAASLKLSPDTMYHALLGEDGDGKRIVPDASLDEFFATVAGIDTAGPEITCFSRDGMDYYRNLVAAVYRAAKARRAMGWNGKLLVHTHVGEGFTTYYAKQPPAEPWTFDNVFAELPVLAGNDITNAQAPQDNISMLLAAIAEVEADYPDIADYVVFRLGHVTHATAEQAQTMANEQVEADVNLDSNLATGAWSFAQMPDQAAIVSRVEAAAADPNTNFALNDLPGLLIPDPDSATEVAGVLGNVSLKYLLMAHVRVMLGTDAAGVEHSSMPREYALAASLIRYWKTSDAAFRKKAGDSSAQTFFDNAAWHLRNMASNGLLPYR
ncbi:MAG: hypothetical protein ACRER1_02945 [Gammaproteobacteria bacterium]